MARKGGTTKLPTKIPGKKAAFPRRVDPMLATRVERVFDDEDWIFEVKWDGYRVIAYKNRNKVSLRSRRFQEYRDIYSTITRALEKLPFSAVLDGEVVMLNNNGHPSYDDLQNVKTLGGERLVYCIFDVLWLEGYSLLDVPLSERKALLDQLIPEKIPHLLNYPFLKGKGSGLFSEMLEKDMEGIVAKKSDSLYSPGLRSEEWLKIQTRIRQEFVIGGWQESESGKPFRSIMFGYYDENNKLKYYGHSGGGYTDKTAAELKRKLLKIETKKKSFDGEVETSTKPHWVKPELVAEFEFATVTKSGKIRKPAIFKGLRSDKDPQNVRLEKMQKTGPRHANSLKFRNKDSNWPKLESSLQRGSENRLDIDGHRLTLNNVERILWSHEEITKADLLRYYIEHAEFILPYLKNRPLSLHIKPNGPTAAGMYIKGMEGKAPSYADTFVVKRKHRQPGKSEEIDYLVCNNLATLVYVVNLGCIDVNPWNSSTAHYKNPDYLVIDIDPTVPGDYRLVVEVAKAVQIVLKKHKLFSLPKTSGKTGLHIYIPVAPEYTFAEARLLVSRLCEESAGLIPDLATTEDSISKRGNKIFLDDNQNDLADTLACPWCIRPYSIPTVSTPLQWSEVNRGLDAADFNIKTISKRLAKKKDPFLALFDKKKAAANAAKFSRLL